MKKVAVIGLGIMGHGIADNFLKNDYTVVVWNRSANKANDLIERGAVLASSVKEAIADADIVFEVTANDESSKEMWQGNEGILANAKPGQYLITCATLSVKWTDELVKKCKDAGLTFFDMPMTGGRVAAEGGQLTLLVGGSADKLNEINDDLQAIAKDVKHFGGEGSGMRYKLILNTLQAIHIAGLGEVLRMADVAGLDKNLVGDALVERPGGVITNIGWQSFKEDPNPITFSVEWIAKDLGYAAEMTGDMQHPLLDEARRLYKNAIEQGHAQADWTKIEKAMTLDEIIGQIKADTAPTPLMIAIEGFGGSGKSTIAEKLKQALGDAYVISIDDFIIKEKLTDQSPDKPAFDRGRLEQEVLIPATTDQPVAYKRLEWAENRLSALIKVPEVDFLIVEGISSYHPSIAKYYDYKIWVDTPIDVARQRGKQKDAGNENEQHWDLWAENDLAYQQKYHPERYADFVLDNSKATQ